MYSGMLGIVKSLTILSATRVFAFFVLIFISVQNSLQISVNFRLKFEKPFFKFR
jgi:hypothetical protein